MTQNGKYYVGKVLKEGCEKVFIKKTWLLQNEKFYSDKVIKDRDEKDFIEKIYMKIKEIKNKVYTVYLGV